MKKLILNNRIFFSQQNKWRNAFSLFLLINLTLVGCKQDSTISPKSAPDTTQSNNAVQPGGPTTSPVDPPMELVNDDAIDTINYMSATQLAGSDLPEVRIENPGYIESLQWLEDNKELVAQIEQETAGRGGLSDAGVPFLIPNGMPYATGMSVDVLRQVAQRNGIDIRTNPNAYRRIGYIFEEAFMRATSRYILHNDSPERVSRGTVLTFTPSPTVRLSGVRPDGLGPTASRTSQGGVVPGSRVEQSAFYEVKSGGTRLSATYSQDNPRQLWGMISALNYDWRINSANFRGNSTLFLITPHGVPIDPDMTVAAAASRVNLISIVPEYYRTTGQITFRNARIIYRVPNGALQYWHGNPGTLFTIPILNAAVYPNWRLQLPSVFDAD